MRGATPTTTQTSGQRPLRRLHLHLYSVRQASNLKQAAENSQTSQLDLQQIPSTVFRRPLHSEDSNKQLRQVQQASWHTPFFRGHASRHSSNNSLTTAKLPPLLLQDVNLPGQQAQRDQPQLPGQWM
jgi:hypothetical protein